jgi:hypothetical protein
LHILLQLLLPLPLILQLGADPIDLVLVLDLPHTHNTHPTVILYIFYSDNSFGIQRQVGSGSSVADPGCFIPDPRPVYDNFSIPDKNIFIPDPNIKRGMTNKNYLGPYGFRSKF